jgi:CHAD domain-containing protein
VRHIAPVIFHQHLAQVKAFDTVLPTEDVPTLHALRIEFKRLRYTLTFFKDVLGATIEDFIDDVKDLQEYLGTLNDAVIARERLEHTPVLSPAEAAVIEEYHALLDAQVAAKVGNFPELWTKFNTRSVQRKLSDALLVMR